MNIMTHSFVPNKGHSRKFLWMPAYQQPIRIQLKSKRQREREARRDYILVLVLGKAYICTKVY